jgi:hypothetical protein
VNSVTRDPTGWRFEGEALLVWGRAGRRPVMLVTLHHTRSPVGPFVEVVVLGLGFSRRLRPRLRRRRLAVGAPAAGEGARAATLKWWSGGRLREVHWEERGLRLRAATGRCGLRAAVPAWLLEGEAAGRTSGNGDGRLPARLCRAWVHVEVPAEDQLAVFAGRRRGLLISTAISALDEPWLVLPRAVRVPPIADPA